MVLDEWARILSQNKSRSDVKHDLAAKHHSLQRASVDSDRVTRHVCFDTRAASSGVLVNTSNHTARGNFRKREFAEGARDTDLHPMHHSNAQSTASTKASPVINMTEMQDDLETAGPDPGAIQKYLKKRSSNPMSSRGAQRKELKWQVNWTPAQSEMEMHATSFDKGWVATSRQ